LVTGYWLLFSFAFRPYSRSSNGLCQFVFGNTRNQYSAGLAAEMDLLASEILGFSAQKPTFCQICPGFNGHAGPVKGPNVLSPAFLSPYVQNRKNSPKQKQYLYVFLCAVVTMRLKALAICIKTHRQLPVF
jgi:hypothetical protein